MTEGGSSFKVRIGKSDEDRQSRTSAANIAQSICAMIAVLAAVGGIVAMYTFSSNPSGGAAFGMFLIGAIAAASL